MLFLKLPIEPHPKPYKVAWINSTFLPVTKRCLVSISRGQYNDSIWCDVIPMTVTHILLGRPWLYDRDVCHIKEDNTYKFMFNNAQIVLKSMSAEQLEQLRQRQKVKLDIPLVINFIIPNEFNDMMRKKNSFVLVLPKVIEELVQVSSLKILILQHLKLEVEFLPTRGV